MTNTPPAGTTGAPEESVYQQAEVLLGQIRTVSETMSVMGKAPHTADMAQMVLKRGALIDALLKLPLEKLTEPERQAILGELEGIRALDNQVNDAMAGIVDDIERQLRNMHDGKQVLKEYRIDSDPERHESTRTDRA